MYLKRVELSGFKSFADRTEFEFVPGITAVIGPNGSGKSNITDAIRWVLGEQSAKTLRGAKMEDVIFAGSDSRKPVNYSEVSLTLDNQDRSLDMEYSEVTVTRRLYRSGESEYYINNQPCRLKDITELFMDTGLGKEAYSIIGQGRIEEILSSKSEDRRGIFEEAAGIVKYKTRKKEAQKKLDETEQNLVRINDLIYELKDQIEPLEEQAKVAKQYKDYANQLKELNIQWYVHDIEKAHLEWQNTENAKKELTKEQIEITSQLSQMDAIIAEKRWHINQLENELDELQQQLLNISEEVEKTEGKREVFREREKNNQTIKTQTIQNLEKFQFKKIEIKNHLQQEKKRLETIEEKIIQLSQQLANEESSLSQLIANHEDKIEGLKEEYFELLNEMATVRNEIRHLASSKESLTYRIDKLNGEREQIEKEKKLHAERLENISREIQHTQDEIEQLSEQYREQLHLQRELGKQQEEKQAILLDQQQKLDALNSRQQVLREMQADFSGFNQGVKEILKIRETQKLKGIHGAVAELIQVPKKYEIAIEVALGGSLQYIVVENEGVGRHAIQYLKDKKLGRATFLPIDVIKGKKISQYDLGKIQQINGYVGVAIDLIEVDIQYKDIIEYFLGQVIITSDLKVANEIAKTLGYRYRIVTLEGDLVNPGGSMTGGSQQRKNINLLSRQREIDELTEQIEQTKKELSNQKVDMEKIKLNIHSTQELLERIRNQGEKERIKEQELLGKHKQIEIELKNIEERLMIIYQEIEQSKDEWNSYHTKEEELKNTLEEKVKKEKLLQKNIEEAESIRKQDESTKEKTNKTITDLKIDLARLQQEKDSSQSLVVRLDTDLKEALTSLEQQQQILIQLENELIIQKQDESTISDTIKELRISKEQFQKQIEEKRNVRTKMLQEIETEELDAKEIRKKLKTVESGIHQCEVKISRLDTELENLLTQLTEEYQMSFEWARQQVMKVENIDLVKRQVKELKEKIQGLGSVNLGAIEEFERVSERYQFLSTQKDDLVEAKQTLYQVIKEIDQEMAKRFIESFEAIREQFQIVFSKLFGGGRADLILSNPDQLLETGIEIVAQPPGKKLQNLALLSGGEKALTAIGLLFAILRVKPVPFCVLDEVEAALDEANVYRFAEYLREFCSYTQFIVVTHRKGTMEGADVLYGVTMQESGVSRLVSVKLEEKEKSMQLA